MFLKSPSRSSVRKKAFSVDDTLLFIVSSEIAINLCNLVLYSCTLGSDNALCAMSYSCYHSSKLNVLVLVLVDAMVSVFKSVSRCNRLAWVASKQEYNRWT